MWFCWCVPRFQVSSYDGQQGQIYCFCPLIGQRFISREWGEENLTTVMHNRTEAIAFVGLGDIANSEDNVC